MISTLKIDMRREQFPFIAQVTWETPTYQLKGSSHLTQRAPIIDKRMFCLVVRMPWDHLQFSNRPEGVPLIVFKVMPVSLISPSAVKHYATLPTSDNQVALFHLCVHTRVSIKSIGRLMHIGTVLTFGRVQSVKKYQYCSLNLYTMPSKLKVSS